MLTGCDHVPLLLLPDLFWLSPPFSATNGSYRDFADRSLEGQLMHLTRYYELLSNKLVGTCGCNQDVSKAAPRASCAAEFRDEREMQASDAT